MTDAHEAVKTRHKETSLAFPVLALAVLFFWGSSQSLPVVVAINIGAGRDSEQRVQRCSPRRRSGAPPWRTLWFVNFKPFSGYSRSQPDFRINGHRRRRADPDARYALFNHHDCYRRAGRFFFIVGRAQIRHPVYESVRP